MSTDSSSASAPTQDTPRQKCPKCGGILDPASGTCSWCATPEVFAPPPSSPKSARMPSATVWIAGIMGLAMIIGALLIPATKVALTRTSMTNPYAIILFVVGGILLTFAGGKYFME